MFLPQYDKVAHPYKTTGKITALYSSIFIFLDSQLEDKQHCLNSIWFCSLQEWNFDPPPKHLKPSNLSKSYYPYSGSYFALHAGPEA
jgi:hypothetical protein